MTLLSDKTEENSTENKFSKEDHYFKIDKRILEIQSTKDLSKSELLVYLQHCRATNPKGKFMGCSAVGKKNTAKINLGLDPRHIEKAENLLIEKHLIRKRNDVKTGILKTIPVEVLAFPEYTPPEKGKSTGFFNPNTETENQHRKYKDGGYINLPSTLIDAGALKELSRQAIFALIWLYNNISWLDYWGVDYFLIRKENSFNDGYLKATTFGEGFNQAIYKKDCLEALEPEPDKWKILKNEINLYQVNLKDSADEIIKAGLFELKPILVQKDKDEPDILRLRQEIFKGFIGFKNDKESRSKYYFCLQEENNHKIIWIMYPTENYIVKTPDYEQYLANRQASYTKQKDLYSGDDFKTRISEHIELINTQDFWDFLNYKYYNIYEELRKIFKAYPEAIYPEDKWKDEFLRKSILPKIPIGVILHYNNSINYVKD